MVYLLELFSQMMDFFDRREVALDDATVWQFKPYSRLSKDRSIEQLYKFFLPLAAECRLIGEFLSKWHLP